MKQILERLCRITVASLPRPEWLERLRGRKKTGDDFRWWDDYDEQGNPYARAEESPRDEYPGIPSQVAEDLRVFDLKPPSSLAEVKQARNREVRKYHSDHFVKDPEKYETSKKIMQIYNAAYDRLRNYYESREK